MGTIGESGTLQFARVELPRNADGNGVPTPGDPAAHDVMVQAGEVLSKKGVSLTLQTPKESVSAQLEVVDSLKPFDNGLFLAHTGGEYRV